MPTETRTSKSHPPGDATTREGEVQVSSDDLFKGRREIYILHNQDRYVLRITRQGKLILNK